MFFIRHTYLEFNEPCFVTLTLTFRKRNFDAPIVRHAFRFRRNCSSQCRKSIDSNDSDEYLQLFAHPITWMRTYSIHFMARRLCVVQVLGNCVHLLNESTVNFESTIFHNLLFRFHCFDCLWFHTRPLSTILQ